MVWRQVGLATSAIAVAVGRANRVPIEMWSFRSSNGSVRIADAVVPGTSHMHLKDAGIIDEPYYRFNELEYRWIAEETWVYETHIEVSDELDGDGASAKLIFETLDGPAHVEVNDAVIGEALNTFKPHAYDVTSLLRPGPNSIRVTFTPPLEYTHEKAADYPYDVPETVNYNVWAEPSHRSFLRKTHSDYGWDWGPAYITTGIAGAAYIEFNPDKPTLEDVDVIQTFPRGPEDLSLVHVAVRVAVDAHGAQQEDVSFEAYVDGEKKAATRTTIAKEWAGDKEVELSFEMEEPSLWWPAGYGEPRLYDVRVDAFNNNFRASISHQVGIRTVELVEEDTVAGGNVGQTFYFRINNVPVYVKGTNWIPSDSFPTRDTPEHTKDLLRSAKDANMNMVRVWGGGRYEKAVFYEECDRLGLLVWQEMMFACGMYPRDEPFLVNTAEEIEYQLKRLRKYTSIVIWGANNENEAMMGQFKDSAASAGESGFNRDVAVADFTKLFVDLIYWEIKSLDSTRPTVDTSPSNGVYSTQPYAKRWGNPQSVSYGDVHFYDYEGDCQDYTMYPRARFISEFGFQSAPSATSLREVSEPEDWDSFHSFWDLYKLRERHPDGTKQLHNQISRRFYVPFPFNHQEWLDMPVANESSPLQFQFDVKKRVESYLYLTQVQQGLCYETAIRTWRRGKQEALGKTMGILYWQLNDVWQGLSWSSIEYSGQWKSLHHFVRREYAPLMLSVHAHPETGDAVFFGVSDVTEEVDMQVTFEVRRTDTGEMVKQVGESVYSLDGLESKELATVALSDVLSEGDGCTLSSCFVYAKCSAQSSEKQVECNDAFQFLAAYKDLHLGSGDITIASVTKVSPTEFQVRLQPEKFVGLFVELEAVGVPGHFSDNSFLILPEEDKVLSYTYTGEDETLSEDAFRKSLELRWLQQVYTRLISED